MAKDPIFIKAYIRKAHVVKCRVQVQSAMDVDTKCMQQDPNSDESKIGYNDSREMFNLEVQQILGTLP